MKQKFFKNIQMLIWPYKFMLFITININYLLSQRCYLL